MRNALSAMAEARKRKEPFMIFDKTLHAESRRQLIIQGELSTAFLQKELFLEYQPIVTPRGAIVGSEALVRWRHPTRAEVIHDLDTRREEIVHLAEGYLFSPPVPPAQFEKLLAGAGGGAGAAGAAG
jgi:EAL domain-containing protein (putative c-di-GMP-specific phosphodiesterase class I)